MKSKFIFLFLFAFLSSFAFCEDFASNSDLVETDIDIDIDIDVRQYQMKNVFPGFGEGSKLQGDLESAKLFKALDITGTCLLSVGALGTVVSSLWYDLLDAFMGDVTSADIWVCGTMSLAGLGLLIGSRIYAWKMPVRFNQNNFVVEPYVQPAADGCTLLIRFVF